MTTRIRRHATTVLAAAFLLAGALAACTPQSAPEPSPTGFASEEEAFAAAEATYRAYVDAVNARRAPDTSVQMAPEDFLTGDALEQSLQVDAQLKASGVRLEGDAEILDIKLDSWQSSRATITVCFDYSAVRVIDSESADVTPETRPDIAALDVQFVYAQPIPLIAQSSVSDATC